jgi:hypothetical protein
MIDNYNTVLERREGDDWRRRNALGVGLIVLSGILLIPIGLAFLDPAATVYANDNWQWEHRLSPARWYSGMISIILLFAMATGFKLAYRSE